MKAGRVRRRTNRAGGMEGGVSNGEQIVLRAAMKPISTLMRPLGTIEMKTREPAQAVAERSDVTAVPAMGVIAEAMTAFVVAQAFLEKFGGDSLGETRRNYENYVSGLSGRQDDRSSAPHLILVGLPGVGKTTIGRAVARKLGRPFLDFDQEIERRSGMDVREIFRLKGEEHFREMEFTLTKELSGRNGAVARRGLDHTAEVSRTFAFGWAYHIP